MKEDRIMKELAGPLPALPPVYAETNATNGRWLPWVRREKYLNTGASARELAPLRVRNPERPDRTLWIAAAFAVVGGAFLISAVLGVERAASFGIAALVAAALNVAFYAVEIRSTRSTRSAWKVWDAVRDLILSQHGGNLVRLKDLPRPERAKVIALADRLEAVREVAKLSHFGAGPIQGEPELLAALGMVGDYARSLQRRPVSQDTLGAPDRAAAEAAVDAYEAFVEDSFVAAATAHIMAGGTRK